MSEDASDGMRPRQRYLLLLTALVPCLLLAAYQFRYLPLLEAGDYAQYLLHAKALAEGRPYTDIGYIFSSLSWDVGPRFQPPGLPLTILPIVAFAGVHSILLKFLLIAMEAAFLSVAFFYFARRTSPWIAAAIPLLTGVALESGYATNTVLSDLGFAALLWGGFVLCDDEKPWTGWRMVWIAVLCVGAILYRFAGIALLGAFTLHAVLNRKPAAKWLLLMGVAAAALSILLRDADPSLIPFVGQMHFEPSSIVVRPLGSIRHYATAVAESFTYPFPGNLLNDAYHLLAAALAGIGLAVLLRRRSRSFLVSFVLVYVVTLTFAPVRSSRYVWPLFPLTAVAFAEGIAQVAHRLRRRGWRLNPAVVAFAVVAALSAAAMARQLRRPEPPSFVGRADVKELFSWMTRANAQDSMRFVFTNPRVLSLETGIPAMAEFSSDSAEFMQEIRRAHITHIVLGSLGTRQYPDSVMRVNLARFPGNFTRVYANDSFDVYRVHATP